MKLSLNRQVTLLPGEVVKRGRTHQGSVNEALHYLAMEIVPPPFLAPRLITWSGDGLVVTRLPGAVLGARKVLDGDVGARTAQACTELALITASWSSPVDGHRYDYRRQLDWGVGKGHLSEIEAQTLRTHETRATRVFQHGDLIPSNILIDGGRAAVVDFEWSGRSAVDGLDWATLLVNGWNAERLRNSLLQADAVRSADGLLNWAATVCHELRQLERDGDGSPWAEEARDMYLRQLPPLRAAIARVMV